MGKLEDTIENIEMLDEEAMEQARERQSQLTKPAGSLGVLED
ncbi:MAG: nicotinate-nucleotide--dimethylbenzimidazole phosphoribosyltransferase, partial [Methermicoccaceae archaeon]